MSKFKMLNGFAVPGDPEPPFGSLVLSGDDPGTVLRILDEDGRWIPIWWADRASRPMVTYWKRANVPVGTGASRLVWSPPTDGRIVDLAVLDEFRKAMEGVLALFPKRYSVARDETQAREAARVIEPDGLGAVVKDGRGRRWVRSTSGGHPWVTGELPANQWRPWAELERPITVLSRGINS